VATPTTQLDNSALRARVLEVVRQLLVELGSQGVLPLLTLQSNLDRDLGLGSLERVELIARWNRNSASACRIWPPPKPARPQTLWRSSTAVRSTVLLLKNRHPRCVPQFRQKQGNSSARQRRLRFGNP